MAENDVDESLMNWNRLFENVLVDAKELTVDLLKGVNYVGASGVLVIALGLYILFINMRYSTVQDPLLYGILFLVTGSNFVVGAFNIYKFFQLRMKYSRLRDIQKEL